MHLHSVIKCETGVHIFSNPSDIVFIYKESGERMVIDIDIKIADSNGKILHRFENQFDDKDASLTGRKYNNARSNFEDFLAEYLSCSGFALREKLINDHFTIPLGKNDTPDTTESTKISADDNMISQLENSELEYRIKLSKNKVLTGKIPLKLESTVTDETTLEDSTQISVTHRADSEDLNNQKVSFQPDTRNDLIGPMKDVAYSPAVNQHLRKAALKKASPDNKEASIDTILNYAMVTAIKKYVRNLSPFTEDEYYADPEAELADLSSYEMT